MKVAMGPPPPLNRNPPNDTSDSTPSSSAMDPPPPPNTNPVIDDSSDFTPTSSTPSSSVEETQSTPTEPATSNPPPTEPATSNPPPPKVPMGPPPPKIPNQSSDHQQQPLSNVSEESNPNQPTRDTSFTIPYTKPPWSHAPPHPYAIEVLKDGLIIGQFNVAEKGAYMFGRVDLCDFVLEHPTISRFHAVLQFKQSGEVYIYDLGSTHGTFVNKTQVNKKVYIELHVGDVIRFGNSSRLYIFQGPSDLMPAESDLKKIKRAKIHEEMQDREASLLRAKQQASLADGISWGMGEDAIEEAEDDADEVTWQTYKGQLTERQEKTRDKIIKRTEKIANMKKEIDAIRVKDIGQGGLTQGQQTQIARNEQRISQILEELESLEETLNESIQESIGARGGKVRGKKTAAVEDEDEVSDDDDFYDRTKKPVIQKGGEHQSIETADSLLAKKETIMKEMEDRRNLLSYEETIMLPEIEGGTEGDALDTFMTGLSSQLKQDTAMKIQKELAALQSELDRILYLLKIVDPTGEASKKRDSKVQEPKSNQFDISSGLTKRVPVEQKKSTGAAWSADLLSRKETSLEATASVIKLPEVVKHVTDAIETKLPVYTATKPQWLGAVHDIDMKENQQEALRDTHESDNFVDYKDRKDVLGSVKNAEVKTESGIEDAAPGLIIRKRKEMERPSRNDDNIPETSVSAEAETAAAEAVALLLKHDRGYVLSDDEHNAIPVSEAQSRKENTQPRRVLGPERPAFLDGNPDYEPWVPPKGQSGDGRTSLNDRYGY